MINKRYMRHLKLPRFTGKSQEMLSNSNALLIGLGGIGLPAITYLACAGVGSITLVDHDIVDETNFNRQFLYSKSDIGKKKSEAIKEKISSINSLVRIKTMNKAIASTNDINASNFDAILDCTDNIQSRFTINDLAILNNIPLFHASAAGYDGRVMSIIPRKSACLKCLSPTITKDFVNHTCYEAGSMGAITGIIGSIQALEAIKYLIGINPSLLNKMLMFDGIKMAFKEFKVKRNAKCACCR